MSFKRKPISLENQKNPFFVVFFLVIQLLAVFLIPPSPAANIPGTFDCELNLPNQKTDSFLIACGDGNELLTKIRWSTWNNLGAIGTGKYALNDCTPYCAAGRFHYWDIKVQLTSPKTFKGKTYLTYINWWQIDKKGKTISGGKSGGWDLYANFKDMGGKL